MSASYQNYMNKLKERLDAVSSDDAPAHMTSEEASAWVSAYETALEDAMAEARAVFEGDQS